MPALRSTRSDLHCLVALDEAPAATAALVAGERLQLCTSTARQWEALGRLEEAEVGGVVHSVSRATLQ